ncbi:hypothetical protein NA78x_002065 [Anatilimnocola sp. NA78]|uniref:hypothetical protein n=1 Tax=Anatilimnocola sp. NA78 TaxID=3415683 RepID=UPI003CE4CEA2
MTKLLTNRQTLTFSLGLVAILLVVTAACFAQQPAWPGSFGNGSIQLASATMLAGDPVAEAFPEMYPGAPNQPLAEQLPSPFGLPEYADGSEQLPGYSSGPMLPGQADDTTYYVHGKARGYYINDQRIEFTGVEATFLVEGAVDAGVQKQANGWLYSCETELFLNQPFERNIYQNTPMRASYAHNFEIEQFQISQIKLSAGCGDWRATIGKFVTPFGRFYYPIYRNNFDDSPFIRSEAILYRETGALLEYKPQGWDFAFALTNGGLEGDTNSSKALVTRAGIDHGWFAAGASAKFQDGVGSEDQKQYKTHYGVDAMVRNERWSLSGELIYDVYGMRRPYPLDNIFWGRSLYYRDVNKAPWEPISGLGYYINLQYTGPQWTLVGNFGQFFPEQLGIRQHDITNTRSLLKASRHWTPNFETYAMLLNETTLEDAWGPEPRVGVYYVFGCQFSM